LHLEKQTFGGAKLLRLIRRAQMLNRICITPSKGSNGLTNARIIAAFKNTFSQEPVMIRSEGKNIIVHTPLELKEKKVRRFAGKLGSFTQFQGKDNSYSFKL